MTATEMIKSVGQKGSILLEGVRISIIVRDVRRVFNRVDFLIEPLHGEGQIWVESGRVKI